MTTNAHEEVVTAEVPKELYIDGRWRPATSGETFDVEDPATEVPIAQVAHGDERDAAAALDAAAAAQGSWAESAPRARGEILRRTYELLTERIDDLALLMTLEMGKPLGESRAEIAYAAEFFRWFAEEAVRIDGRYTREPAGRGRLLVLRQPVGPCLLITPWNFPMAMGARKIAPAIAAGATMIVKPAALTPLSMNALVAILAEAGLPSGVCNVVTTRRAGATLAGVLADSRLRKLSFTGSTEVGRQLIAAASSQVLRVSMELGGNAPFVVFDDADVGAAVDGAVIAKMRNIGQACTAANRFLVHESVADEFTTALTARLAGMRVGRGTDPDVEVGPLIDDGACAKVTELVDDAQRRGARAVLPGGPLDGKGHFYTPVVLTDVAADARIQHEEIFGPVAPISTFTDETEAIRAANDTEYGLVAYVFTRDMGRALRVCERIETGMVGLNQGLVSNPAAPFGGVKHSGFGREGGSEGIGEYLETKYVAIHLDAPDAG